MPETLEQVGATMRVTRERIRQIESKATLKIAPMLRDLLGDASWPLPVKKERAEALVQPDKQLETDDGAVPDEQP